MKPVFRIEMETVTHADNDFATVAFVRIKKAVLEEKQPSTASARIPPLLDEDMVEIQQAVEAEEDTDSEDTAAPTKPREASEAAPPLARSVSQRGSWIVVGTVEVPSADSVPLEDEVNACFRLVRGLISNEHPDQKGLTCVPRSSN
jgi:diphthine-ammonia ligase